MNKIKQIILPVSVGILLVVLAGISYANSENKDLASGIIHPTKGAITEQIRFSGKVQPKDTLDLGFQISGKVSKVYVKIGDKVEKGQLLAELNPEETNIAYSQSISDLEIAKAQLEQARYDEDAQEAKLKSVKKSSSANKYDEEYQKEIKHQSESNIKAKEALLRRANESVQNSRLQIGKTKLYAPIGGVITKQSLDEGELVYYYSPVVSLMGSNELEIEAYVSEIEVAKISIGDKAKVKIDASQVENFQATVSVIEPIETSVANVSSYKISFIPDFSGEKLKSGMMTDMTLDLGEKKNALIIPEKSVFKEKEKTFVLVAVGDDRIKKEVRLGINDQEGNVEVLSGIEEQDEVISFNQSK